MCALLRISTTWAACLVATPSFAEPCEVEVRGVGDQAWAEALGELRAQAEQAPESDCALIRVEIDGGAARLTFKTRDGRMAERQVADPRDLAATVDALYVTGPAEPVPVQPQSRDEPEPARPSAGPAGRAAVIAHPTPIFALLGGARGGASGLVSPVLRGSAALELDRWELAILGGLDVHYENARSTDAPPSNTGAVIAGVGVGRREPAGPLTLLGSGQFQLAMLSDEPDSREKSTGRAEVRLAACAGVVAPARAPLRFRADLGFEVVPHGSGANDPRLTPWWALSLLLGVEVGGP